MNALPGCRRPAASILVLFFAALAFPAFSAPGSMSLNPVWARSAGSSAGWSVFSGGAADPAGNVYAAGSIRGGGSFDFGGGISLSGSPDYETAVIVKYDAAGKTLWARSVKGGESRFSSVVLCASGAVCAAGSAAGLALIVQYGPEGNELWEYCGDAEAQESAYNAVTVDGKGSVYAAGFAVRKIAIRRGYIEDSEPPRWEVEEERIVTEGLVAKYSEQGSLQWSRGTFEHGNQPDEAAEEDWEPIVFLAAAADQSENGFGRVYVGGTMSGSFAVTYAADGRLQQGIGWFEQDPKAGYKRVPSRCTGLSNVPYGYLLASGSFEGAAQHAFEERGPAVKGTAATNALVAGCDLVWPEWARTTVSGSGKSEYTSVVFSAGFFIAAGYAAGAKPVVFGDKAQAQGSSQGRNAVIVQYGYEGRAQAARSVSAGSVESEFKGLAACYIDEAPFLYAVGAMTGKGRLTFGTGVSADGKSAKSTAIIVKYALKDLTEY